MDEHALQAEFAAVQAESIGWQPLGECAYLHVGDPEGEVITVVGLPDNAQTSQTVLLLV